jgi:hypothetical protein
MVAGVQQIQQKARLSEALEQSPTNAVAATIHLLEVVQGRPAHAAFTARILTAVANMVEAADEEAVIDAVGAPSDYDVLIQVLDQPKILDALRERDPLAPARIRGLRARERLLSAEGGTYSVQEAAVLLGLTRQAVDKRRKAGKLLAVTMGKTWHVFPAWQFVPSGVLPGLEEVLADLSAHDVWMQIAFLLAAHTMLDGETPLNVLRRGEIERVRATARLYGEQTAL